MEKKIVTVWNERPVLTDGIRAEVIAAHKEGRELSEEISDIIKVEVLEREEETRLIVSFV